MKSSVRKDRRQVAERCLRFTAACHAMQGLLSDPIDRADECLPGEPCHKAVARLAVAHADALLERLEAPPAP